MLPDSLFNNLSNVFKRRSQLLLLVVTQSDIVSNLAIIADRIHGIHKLDSCFLMLPLFVKNATFVDYNVGIFMVA